MTSRKTAVLPFQGETLIHHATQGDAPSANGGLRFALG